jgi:hypothetical protein
MWLQRAPRKAAGTKAQKRPASAGMPALPEATSGLDLTVLMQDLYPDLVVSLAFEMGDF